MTAQRYRAASPQSCRKVLLDGLTLVYHRASGITHMMMSPLPEILSALEAGPADTRMLAERLSGQFEMQAEDAAIEDVLNARLAELADMGLVEPA